MAWHKFQPETDGLKVRKTKFKNYKQTWFCMLYAEVSYGYSSTRVDIGEYTGLLKKSTSIIVVVVLLLTNIDRCN